LLFIILPLPRTRWTVAELSKHISKLRIIVLYCSILFHITYLFLSLIPAVLHVTRPSEIPFNIRSFAQIMRPSDISHYQTCKIIDENCFASVLSVFGIYSHVYGCVSVRCFNVLYYWCVLMCELSWVTADDQSTSLSWYWAPRRGPWSDFILILSLVTDALLFFL
jgi:hypothetical protein